MLKHVITENEENYEKVSANECQSLHCKVRVYRFSPVCRY